MTWWTGALTTEWSATGAGVSDSDVFGVVIALFLFSRRWLTRSVGHHSPPVSSEGLVPAFQESSQQRREPFDGSLYRIVRGALLAHVRLVDAATHDGLTDMAVFLSTDDAFGEQTSSALPLADVAGFHRFAWHFDFHIGFEFDVMPNHALQRTAASRLGFNRAVSWPPSLSSGRSSK